MTVTDHSRWNIDRDGDDLLICFGDHEKGDKCEYVRYVPATQLAALQRDHAASAARVARLEAICASVYQYVGIDAPVRFLDALALHDEYMEMTPDQIIETLLPTWKEDVAQPDAARPAGEMA